MVFLTSRRVFRSFGLSGRSVARLVRRSLARRSVGHDGWMDGWTDRVE